MSQTISAVAGLWPLALMGILLIGMLMFKHQSNATISFSAMYDGKICQRHGFRERMRKDSRRFISDKRGPPSGG